MSTTKIAPLRVVPAPSMDWPKCGNPQCDERVEPKDPRKPGPKPKYHSTQCRDQYEVRRRAAQQSSQGRGLPRSGKDVVDVLETAARGQVLAADELREAVGSILTAVESLLGATPKRSPHGATPDEIWLGAHYSQMRLSYWIGVAEKDPTPENFEELHKAAAESWDTKVELAETLGVNARRKPASPRVVPPPVL